MTYDPTKTYRNYGDRDLTTLQAAEMLLDAHTSMNHLQTVRMYIMIAPTLEQLRMLMSIMPEAFDSVDPEV